jgi:hypothetical protein
MQNPELSAAFHTALDFLALRNGEVIHIYVFKLLNCGDFSLSLSLSLSIYLSIYLSLAALGFEFKAS